MTAKKFFPILLVVFGLPAMARLDENKKGIECTIETFTQDCEVFSKNPNWNIEFSDGTSIGNEYARIMGQSNSYNQNSMPMQKPPDPAKVVHAKRTALEAQAAIINDPGLKGSDEFKLAFTDTTVLLNLNYLGSMQSQSTNGYGLNLILPWPPDSKNYQSVNPKELKTYLDSLPQKTRDNINSHAEKLTKAHADAWGLNGGYGMGAEKPSPQPPKYSWRECLDKLNDEKKCRAFATPLDTEPSPTQIRRLTNLYRKTKENLIAEISEGRPRSQLSPQQEFMVKKLELMAPFTIVPCPNKERNASYLGANHRIEICREYGNNPDIDLIAAFAHELGHAIDPCRAHHCVHQMNAFDPQAEGEPLSIKTENQKKLFDYIMSNNGSINASLEYQFPQEDIDWAIKQGLLTNLTPKPNDYILSYQSAYTCLQQETRIKANTLEDFKMNADVRKRAFDNVYGKNNSYSNSVKLPSEKYLECIGASPGTEAVADMWAAKVVGRYLNNFESFQLGTSDGLKLFSVFQANVCQMKLTNNVDWSVSSSTHPPSRERVEQIFMQEPRIRKAFGCIEPVQHRCLELMGTTNDSEKNSNPDSKKGIK